MTSQVPFKPLTPEAFGRLTEDEQASFTRALQYVAEGWPLPAAEMGLLADLVEMVQRLVTDDTAGTELARVRREAQSEREAVRADLGQLLELLGLGDYGRPQSPHEVFLECLSGVRGYRERAEAAEAKLAAIEAHCRKAVENASLTAYMPVDPWDVRASAGAVLGIISDGEGGRG